jgi:hypothetical protein
MIPAVGHVKENAAPPRVRDRSPDPARFVQDPVPPPVQKVAHHIARTEKLEDKVQRGWRVCDVDHHAESSRQVCCSDRAPQRLEPRLPHDLFLVPHLDAEDEVPMLSRDAGSCLGVGIGKMVELPDPEISEPDGRDVEEGQDANAAPRDHELAHPLEGRGPGTPAVHKGGHSGRGTHGIGAGTQVSGADETMSVLINEAGDHQLAGHVNDRIAVSGQGRADLRHVSPPEPDVVSPAYSGKGI